MTIQIYGCVVLLPDLCPSNTRLLIYSISHKSQKKCDSSVIMYRALLRRPQDVRACVLMRMVNRSSIQNFVHLMIGRIFYRLAFGSVQFKACFLFLDFFFSIFHILLALDAVREVYLNRISVLVPHSMIQCAMQIFQEAITTMGQFRIIYLY